VSKRWFGSFATGCWRYQVNQYQKPEKPVATEVAIGYDPGVKRTLI
jgi:hypothetical protein